MHEFLDKFLEYGYLILFIYSLGGGMLALAALGAFSAQHEQISPLLAMLCAGVGNFLGASALFYLCKHNKKDFQKHLIQHKRKIALLTLYFRKHGFLLTLFCKFLYGFKTIAPLAAELSKLSMAKYSIYNAISCILWSVCVFYVSYSASAFVLSLSEKINPLYLFAAFVCVAACIWLFMSKKTRKKDA